MDGTDAGSTKTAIQSTRRPVDDSIKRRKSGRRGSAPAWRNRLNDERPIPARRAHSLTPNDEPMVARNAAASRGSRSARSGSVLIRDSNATSARRTGMPMRPSAWSVSAAVG
jgi:hypothetical protein